MTIRAAIGLLVLCLMVFVFVFAWMSAEPSSPSSPSSDLTYHHDTIHGVGCWSLGSVGMFCLPDSEYHVQ